MQLPDWRFAFASAIGNSHIDGGIPCQDFCAVTAHPGFTISVVCDGAGSCDHAHLGARQVAHDCMIRFAETIKSKRWDAGKKCPSRAKWQSVARLILRQVRQDLENYSRAAQLPFKSLACTVIVVITLNGGLLVTHIGDGRAGYCDQHGGWHAAMTPFHGAEANETVFITSDIWTRKLEDIYIESRVITDDVKAFCLLSDGCEKAAFECNLYDPQKALYYDPNRPYPLFFNPNVAAIPRLVEDGSSQEDINAQWQAFLTNGNAKLSQESDDKTLILGVKVAAKT